MKRSSKEKKENFVKSHIQSKLNRVLIFRNENENSELSMERI